MNAYVQPHAYSGTHNSVSSKVLYFCFTHKKTPTGRFFTATVSTTTLFTSNSSNIRLNQDSRCYLDPTLFDHHLQ